MKRSFYFKTAYFVFFFSLACTGWNCGTNSQRFTSSSRKVSTSKKEKKNARYTAPIKEEVDGDDKKVDIEKIKERFSSTDNLKQSPPSKKKISQNEAGKKERDRMMEEILSMLGVPYLWGGEDENGIDCSAFTRRVFQKTFSLSLPRTAKQQMQGGKVVAQPELKFGDLVFFNTLGVIPSHVGIYVDDHLFAHASESFGVTISSLESSYYKERYVGARRVVK